jgi:hypothetical protein
MSVASWGHRCPAQLASSKFLLAPTHVHSSVIPGHEAFIQQRIGTLWSTGTGCGAGHGMANQQQFGWPWAATICMTLAGAACVD